MDEAELLFVGEDVLGRLVAKSAYPGWGDTAPISAFADVQASSQLGQQSIKNPTFNFACVAR